MTKSRESPLEVRIPLHYRQLSLLAEQYKSEMGPAAAVTILERWQKIFGTHVLPEERLPVYASLAQIYAGLLDAGKAEFYGKKVLAAKPAVQDAAPVVQSLAEMYWKMNQGQKGIDFVEKVLKAFPDLRQSDRGTIILDFEAHCYMELGDYTKATNLLEAIDKQCAGTKDPKFNLIRNSLIICLCKQGELSRVPDLIDECAVAAQSSHNQAALANVYKDAASSLYQGAALEESNKYCQKAKVEFERIGDLTHATECDLQIAMNYVRMKQFKQAIQIYKQELQHNPKPSDQDQGQLCRIISECFASLGDLKEAHLYAQQAIDFCYKHFQSEKGDMSSDTDLRFANSIFSLTNVLVAEGNQDEAKKTLDQWITKVESKAPESLLLVALLDNKCSILNDQKCSKELLECSSREIAILSKPIFQSLGDPHENSINLSNAYARKASALQKMSKFSQAEETCREGWNYLQPNRFLFDSEKIPRLLGLSRLLSACGKTREALDYYAKIKVMLQHPEAGKKTLYADWVRQLADLSMKSNADLKAAEVKQRHPLRNVRN